MNIFKYFATSIWNLISNKGRLDTLSKENIISILQLNIKTHKSLKVVLKAYTTKDLNSINIRYNRMISVIPKNRLVSRDIHSLFVAQLTGEAKRLELSKCMGAMIKANEDFLDIQEDILKNIDKIMEEKALTIFNTRVTYLVLLGIMRQADMFSKFFTFYHEQICAVIGDRWERIPRYRSEFLINNYKGMAVAVSNICDKKGRYTFLTEVDRIKRKNNDLLLYSNKSTIDMYAKQSDYSRSTLVFSVFGMHILNIFSVIGEAIVKFRHDKYLRDKNTKEWMEAHVAMLKLDMLNIDRNSPEYVKLEKVVATYSEMITDYDRKIADYLGDEAGYDTNPYDMQSV